MKYLLLLTFLVSCGMDIDGLESLEKIEADIETDIPEAIAIEPDFEKAMRLCDQRYGVKTKESEECFEDFRNYYKTSFGLDLSGVIDFCEDRYNTIEEQELCQDELLDIIGNQTTEENV